MGIYSGGMSTYPLILASGSPRRRAILDSLAVPYQAVVADVREDHWEGDPSRTVSVNARRKHDWCRSRYPAAWIVAADTVVSFDGRALGKPASMAEARAWLQAFAGCQQQIYTGVALSSPHTSVAVAEVVCSDVQFLDSGHIDIEGYLAAVSPLDKAGGYNVAERGELLMASFRGSWTNIMGLPREWLAGQLAEILPQPVPPSPFTTMIKEQEYA